MASDTPAGQPATLAAAAVQAATAALHYGDPAENDGTGCACTSADQHDEFWHRDQADAVRALEAAALNDFRRTSRDDYQDTYRDWWAGIVEHPDGTLNRDQVARELADYAALMSAASEVYCAVTNGRISKPNTLPSAVIGLAEECAQELAGEVAREAAAAERERCMPLPPKWHGADYAARRISDIANRPPGAVRQVLDAHIDWLLEEVAWLNQQLAARPAPPPPAIIHVDGELDEATAEKFRRELAEVLPDARRVAELEALAAGMLASFTRGSDGYRARAGQVQIGKWEAALGTEALARHPETRR